MQTCIWPSWCHCHSLSLASVKSRLVPAHPGSPGQRAIKRVCVPFLTSNQQHPSTNGWRYNRVWNDEVLQWTGLTSLSHLVSHWCTSLSGHLARAWRQPTGKHGSSAPCKCITQLTSWLHVASPTWSSTEQVAPPATKLFRLSHWRPLEGCCQSWIRWWNDVMALTGYGTMMMMMRNS